MNKQTCPGKVKFLLDGLGKSQYAFALDCTIILAAFCLVILVINPAGNFPLNDDWAFAATVRYFMETGEFHPSGWASMSLFSNVLWGALFCLPKGFSFDALRLSTLVASMVGVLGVYAIARECKQKRSTSLLAAFSVEFNPIYGGLSFTFMTDVPFTAAITLSVLFFVRSITRSSNGYLWLGGVLSVAAALSRQFALCVPLAFAITHVVRFGLKRKPMMCAVALVAVPTVAILALGHWVWSRVGEMEESASRLAYLMGVLSHPGASLLLVLGTEFVLIAYLGLFLLPILLFSRPTILREFRVTVLQVGMLFLMIAGGVILFTNKPLFGEMSAFMPIWGNILDGRGIGPVSLRDIFVLGLDHVPALPRPFWILVTVMSFVGSVLLTLRLGELLSTLLSRARTPSKALDIGASVNLFLMCASLIYLAALPFPGYVFDRYILPALPMLIGALLNGAPPPSAVQSSSIGISKLIAVVSVACWGWFTIAGTRDYLEWNRVRWSAIRHLMTVDHIGPEAIDGGFEFGGTYLYDPTIDFHKKAEALTPPDGTSWYWIKDDTYQLGFGSVPGYTIVREYGYERWLSPGHQKIVVMKRN